MLPNKVEQRIEGYRRRFDAAPASRAFAPLADALREAGRHEEALALLEEGLIRHPRFVGGLVILGRTLLDAGRTAHGRKVLKTVLERDAGNVVALRLLAEEARCRQDWPEASRLLAELVAADPGEEQWSAALAEARANRNISDPADVPDTSFATMTLVEIYLAQGYRAKAMRALRQMQQREPDREDIREKIAEIGILEESAAASGSGGQADVSDDYARRRELLVAKRTEEKKNFEEWITRLRTDEEARP